MNLFALLLFILSIVVFIQTLNKLYDYYVNKKTKDVVYYWSILLCVLSVAGLVISGTKLNTPMSISNELLPSVNVKALAAYGTSDDISQLRKVIEQKAENVKTLLEAELAGKYSALDELSNAIQTRGVAIHSAEAAITAPRI